MRDELYRRNLKEHKVGAYMQVFVHTYVFSSSASSYMTYAHIASALIFISTPFFFSSVALRSLNQTELP